MKVNQIHTIFKILYWILLGLLWHIYLTFNLRLKLNQVSGTGLLGLLFMYTWV